MTSRLHERYAAEVVPALQKQFEYRNANQVPRLSKIVVNIGLGEALTNAKALDAAIGDLSTITGQKPIVTKAKRSIAQFRLRTGNSIGAKVTLRGERMWDFLDRLTTLALPRIRDFRGVPGKSFDGRGNYSLGMREQLAFPEIDYDKVDRLRGLEISIVTTAKTDEEFEEAPRAPRHALRVVTAGEERHGKEIDDRQGKAQSQAQGAGVPPLLRVRATTRLHATVRAVPHLLPGACAPGRAARRHEVELVGRPMNISDPIADMLTRVRNASRARHTEVVVPASRTKREIARILKDEGFIADVNEEQDGAAAVLRLTLKYVDGKVPVVSGLKRISKPGLRVYARKTDIPRVLGGLGIVIVSTSQGIMTGQQARQAQLGGEVLAYVW